MQGASMCACVYARVVCSLSLSVCVCVCVCVCVSVWVSTVTRLITSALCGARMNRQTPLVQYVLTTPLFPHPRTPQRRDFQQDAFEMSPVTTPTRTASPPGGWTPRPKPGEFEPMMIQQVVWDSFLSHSQSFQDTVIGPNADTLEITP